MPNTTFRNAGILLGIGLGGFLDGILFHQIFQFHNMLSSRYFPDSLANEQINMVWDGLFHLFTWDCTAAGVWLLWKAALAQRNFLSGKYLLGTIALGWGFFNFTEGLIDHQIIGLHHVVERASGGMRLFWDLLFLASGVILAGCGYFLMGRGARQIAGMPGKEKGPFPRAV